MKGLQSKRNQRGFTIIELVVVILLLGILTATALPRFIDVTDDAHDAVVSAVVGGLGTGTALYKAQWYADNQPTVISQYGNLNPNNNGFPIGIVATPSNATVKSSVGITQNCVDIFQNVLQLGGQPSISSLPAGSTAPGSMTTLKTAGLYDFVAYLRDDNLTNKNICYYYYTGQFGNVSQASIPTITYNASTGAVTVSEL